MNRDGTNRDGRLAYRDFFLQKISSADSLENCFRLSTKELLSVFFRRTVFAVFDRVFRDIIIAAKPDDIARTFPAVFLDRSIVLAGCIDIFVAQHISDQIDIPGCPVETGPVGAAEFMRGDLFECDG